MLKNARLLLLAIFPILLIAINLGLKLLFLTSQEISLDEPFTIYHAQFDWPTIVVQLKEYNNPPLYELVLHVWIKIFGIEPVSVRLLPTLFAALSPLALYFFARRFFSNRIAVVSSLLLTFSSLLTFYAHDCRVYSLFVLLSILSNRYFLEAAQFECQARQRILFALVSTLLLYAHYFGLFVLFVQAIVLVLFYRKKLRSFFWSYLVVIALYLPQMYTMVLRINHSVGQGTWLEPPEGIESLYNMIWAFSNAPVVAVTCIFLLLLAAYLQIRRVTQLRINAPKLLVLLWFTFAFAGMYFISFSVPMYIPRYVLYSLPAYCLVLTFAVEVVFKTERLKGVFYFVLLAIFAFTTDLNPDKKHGICPAVNQIRSQKDKHTLVAIRPRDLLPNFTYYYRRSYFKEISDGREYHLTDSLLRDENIFFINGPADLAKQNSTYKKVLWISYGENYKAKGITVGNLRYKLTRSGRHPDNIYWSEFVIEKKF